MNTYPQPYLDFLVYFHGERDYFECHEVLEAYWKETAGSRYSRCWHGLIQIAVALYHERRGNRAGASKMLAAAILHLSGEPLQELGLNREALLESIRRRAEELKQANASSRPQPFADLNLPIADPQLERMCRQQAEQTGFEWLRPSPMNKEWLLSKHTLRDRRPVIEERSQALERRKGKPE